jgi:hypothetical protein
LNRKSQSLNFSHRSAYPPHMNLNSDLMAGIAAGCAAEDARRARNRGRHLDPSEIDQGIGRVGFGKAIRAQRVAAQL